MSRTVIYGRCTCVLVYWLREYVCAYAIVCVDVCWFVSFVCSYTIHTGMVWCDKNDMSCKVQSRHNFSFSPQDHNRQSVKQSVFELYWKRSHVHWYPFYILVFFTLSIPTHIFIHTLHANSFQSLHLFYTTTNQKLKCLCVFFFGWNSIKFKILHSPTVLISYRYIYSGLFLFLQCVRPFNYR